MTIPLLKYADAGGGDCNDSQQATASVARRPSHFPAYHQHAQHAQHHQGGTVDLHDAVQRAVSDVNAVRFAAHATSSVPVPVHPSYHHPATLLQNAGNYASSVVMRRNLIMYPPLTSANNIQQHQHPGPPLPPTEVLHYHYHPHPYPHPHQHQHQHQHYPAHPHPHGRIIPTPTASANVNNVNVNHIIISNNSEIVNSANTNAKNSASFSISRPEGAAIPVRLTFVPVLERPPTYNNSNSNNVTTATSSKVNEKHQHHAPVPLNNSDPHKQQQQRPAARLSSTNSSKIEVIDVDIDGDSCDDHESTKSKTNTNTNKNKNTSNSNSVKPNISVIIKKSNKRRKIFVEGVTEWRIPSDSSEVVDKYGFIVSSLQKGLDPDSIPIPDHPDNNVNVNVHEHEHEEKQQQQQNDLPSNTKIDSNKIKKMKKNHKNHKKKETTTKMDFPKVIDAEFDNRFLEYKLSSDGIMKQKDILVRSLLSFSNNILVMKNNKNCQNIANKPWENYNDHIEVIPDEPPRSKTSSRVGPQYAAEITPKLNSNDDSVAAAADATSTTFGNSSILPG
jgi:hypothetical protein